MSKLKSVWKKRALDKLTALPGDHSKYGPSPLAVFKVKTFAEIRARLGEQLKLRMPLSAQAIDDPTSNVSALLDAIAASDTDLFIQADIIAKAMGWKP